MVSAALYVSFNSLFSKFGVIGKFSVVDFTVTFFAKRYGSRTPEASRDYVVRVSRKGIAFETSEVLSHADIILTCILN